MARSAVFVAGIGLLAWAAAALSAGAQVTTDYSIVHSFAGSDGEFPEGSLIEGGVNYVGANGDGAGPFSALIEDGAGVFYGTAALGGSFAKVKILASP